MNESPAAFVVTHCFPPRTRWQVRGRQVRRGTSGGFGVQQRRAGRHDSSLSEVPRGADRGRAVRRQVQLPEHVEKDPGDPVLRRLGLPADHPDLPSSPIEDRLQLCGGLGRCRRGEYTIDFRRDAPSLRMVRDRLIGAKVTPGPKCVDRAQPLVTMPTPGRRRRDLLASREAEPRSLPCPPKNGVLSRSPQMECAFRLKQRNRRKQELRIAPLASCRDLNRRSSRIGGVKEGVQDDLRLQHRKGHHGVPNQHSMPK